MAYPQQISEILPGVVAKLGLTQKVREASILEDWGEIVGKPVARHCQPVTFDKCVLTVHVDSSPWLNELQRFSKSVILQKLKDKLGEKSVKDIKFRIGQINPA